MNHALIIVLLAFAISLPLGIYIIPRMMMISVKNTWDRRGDELNQGGVRVYQIAGISIFPLMLITLCATLMMPLVLPWQELAKECASMVPRTFSLITGSTLLYIVGLKYDLHGASTGIRLSAILLASCVFAASNMRIENLHGLFGIYMLPLWVSIPLTILTATYIIFTFRMLDGFDSLISGQGVLTLLLLSHIYLGVPGLTPTYVTASMLGVMIPYWVVKTFWRRWDRCTMGNSGSYVLGFIIAYLFLVIQRRSGASYYDGADLVAFSILMLPMLDIMRVIGSRLHDGREVFTQDRNQINDKLYRMGIGRYGVFVMLLLIYLIFASVTYAIVHLGMSHTLVVIVDLVMWLIMHWVINWRIHAYETFSHREAWNKEYGEEAWNAQVPVEILEKKIRTFGTMGLPSNMVEKDTMAFIPDGMTGMERGMKRGIDMLISFVCIIVFSPLFLLSYILIKLDDGGPAIYKQERIGRFGRPFCIYKYRSMRLDAEKMGPQLSHAGGDEDPRLTKIGKFLRRHHLDELPQLWNVLVGDMAFVGYRPERKHFIDQIMQHDPRYSFLYQIRPGVTSYATLYNGYTDTMEKMLRRLELDLYYLRHRSFWFDIKVLILTFGSIIFGKKF